MYQGKTLRRMMVFIALVNVTFALQRLPVMGNGSVTASMADSDINRIAIEGERIKTVRGLENQYTLNQDTQAGEIYLKPLVPQTAIHLFLTTETNKTYQLHLRPTSKTAETIVLKPLENKPLKSLGLDALSSYESSLLSLVQAMAKTEAMDAYEITTFSSATARLLKKDITVTKVKTYDNGTFQGDVYVIQNQSHQLLNLTESQFYRPHTRAIAFSKTTVPPQGTTYLYTVRQHGT